MREQRLEPGQPGGGEDRDGGRKERWERGRAARVAARRGSRRSSLGLTNRVLYPDFGALGCLRHENDFAHLDVISSHNFSLATHEQTAQT